MSYSVYNNCGPLFYFMEQEVDMEITTAMLGICHPRSSLIMRHIVCLYKTFNPSSNHCGFHS